MRCAHTWLAIVLPFLGFMWSRSTLDGRDGSSSGRRMLLEEHQVGVHAVEPTVQLRALQQTEALTVVTTASELQVAADDGASHILIEDHLDLTGLRIEYLSYPSHNETVASGLGDLLGDVSVNTKSIRGNCAMDPTGLTIAGLTARPLLDRLPLQCVLVIDANLLDMRDEMASLWLDNLYLRAQNDFTRDPVGVAFFHMFLNSMLWMTNLTIQGDVPSVVASMHTGASLFAEGCTFANLGGPYVIFYLRGSGTTATFVDCLFKDNDVADSASYLLSVQEGASALLRNPTLQGNKQNAANPWPIFSINDVDVEDSGSRIFVEDGEITVGNIFTQEVFDVSGDTTQMSDYEELQFLNSTNDWFIATQQEAEALTEPPTPTPAPAAAPARSISVPMPAEASSGPASTPDDGEGSSGGDGAEAPFQEEEEPGPDDTNWGLIAGIVVLICVVAALALAAVLFLRWRRRRKEAKGRTPAPQTANGKDATAAPVMVAANSPRGVSRLGPGAQPDAETPALPLEFADSAQTASSFTTGSRAASGFAWPRTTTSTTGTPQQSDQRSAMSAPASKESPAVSRPTEVIDTFEPEPLPDRAPPRPSASAAEHMEYLHFQLDVSEGRDVLQGLVLQPGGASRIQGGQAIVNFAKDKRTELMYAVKFFVSKQAFEDEKALYLDTNNPLGRFLPQLRSIVEEERALLDGRGRPFPPCIIMEKGESLDLWARRNQGVDVFAVMQVIHNIAERLGDMHDCGYVHRDIKPSNIMLLPRTNRWTLIDFGCAVRTGKEASLNYTLAYASPEVVQAVKAGQRTIVARNAMDAWALGIVAVELFSNNTVINSFEGKEQIMKRIVGELPLPWEAGAPGANAVLRSIGRLQSDVLELLHREPERRISMQAFVRRCRSIYAQTSVAS